MRRVHVEGRVLEPLAQQLRERVPNAGDLVFPTPRGAMWDGSNFRERVFDPAKRRARLDEMIFQDLRHTYASLLIAAKRPADGGRGTARAYGREASAPTLRAPVSGSRGSGRHGARLAVGLAAATATSPSVTAVAARAAIKKRN